MSQREKGMVLLMSIMMISLLTLLVLTLLQAVLLYVKVSQQVTKTHHALYQLEAAAMVLVKNLPVPDCSYNNEDPNQMLALLLNEGGCAWVYEKETYHYLVDDLGLYPCLKVMSDNRWQSSHHWLITIKSSSPRQSILQLRIVTPSQAITCDGGESRAINQGVISWRNLPLIGIMEPSFHEGY